MGVPSPMVTWGYRRLKLRVDAKGDATVEVLSGEPVLLRCANSSDAELAVGDAPHLLYAPVHAVVLETTRSEPVRAFV